MQILPVTMSFVIVPIAFIDIAVGMSQFTIAICFIISPLAFVFGSIRPLLSSLSIFEPIFPLAGVDHTVF
jgi:hypothetical protein